MNRQFLKKANTTPNEVIGLLQSIFTLELVKPSEEIWLVSPWVSDIPILDNRNSGFYTLCPEWELRFISLREVLLELIFRGARVVVVTREDGASFEAPIRDHLVDIGCEDRFKFLIQNQLHTKGIFTDSGCLVGSMNFTNNGLNNLDEFVEYKTLPDEVSRLRMDLRAIYES